MQIWEGRTRAWRGRWLREEVDTRRAGNPSGIRAPRISRVGGWEGAWLLHYGAGDGTEGQACAPGPTTRWRKFQWPAQAIDGIRGGSAEEGEGLSR